MTRERDGVGLIEVLVASSLMLLLSLTAYGAYRGARGLGQSTIAAQVGLQMATRRTLSELTRSVQESIEVVRPPPGATLGYALIRDKRNHLVLIYAAGPHPGSSPPAYQLRMFRRDTSAGGAETSDRLLLPSVERATFTTLGPGLLQVHLTLREDGRSYPLLTALRCRNGPSEVEP